MWFEPETVIIVIWHSDSCQLLNLAENGGNVEWNR